MFAAIAFFIAGGAHAFNFPPFIPKVPVPQQPPVNPMGGFDNDAPAAPSIECGDVPKIKINTITDPNNAPQYLQDVLDNIATPGEVGLGPLLSAKDGKYHVCFEFEKKPFSNVVEPVLVMNTVELHIPNNLNSAVVIEHLILKNVDLPPADPVIRIKNAGKGVVTIKDMIVTEAVNGVSIESVQGAAGNIKIMNSKVECTPEGYGINVEMPNTILDTVEVAGCGDGFIVNASNIQVLNSKIHHNGIGVRMLKDGARIENSIIYANDSGEGQKFWRLDGIRDEVVGDLGVELVDREVEFFKNPSGDKIDSDSITFTNTPGYIGLPEMPSGEAVLNLYYTNPSLDCKAQACELIYSVKVKPGDFDASGLFTFDLQAKDLNKQITAIYSEPTKRSTVITRGMMLAYSPQIVAFVTTPYDIPTGGVQQPVEDKKIDGDDVSGYTGGTDFDGLEGYDPNALEVGDRMSGDNVDNAAPGVTGCNRGASLIEADHRAFLLGGSALWILLALGILVAGRSCAVRIRLKTRRHRRD